MGNAPNFVSKFGGIEAPGGPCNSFNCYVYDYDDVDSPSQLYCQNVLTSYHQTRFFSRPGQSYKFFSDTKYCYSEK